MRILTIRFTAEMWNISQYIAIYGPDILENIGIYWLILRYIRPVDTSPVYSNIFQYMPELIPGRNKSILEYIGVYCDILCTIVRLGYTAMYPNILTYQRGKRLCAVPLCSVLHRAHTEALSS